MCVLTIAHDYVMNSDAFCRVNSVDIQFFIFTRKTIFIICGGNVNVHVNDERRENMKAINSCKSFVKHLIHVYFIYVHISLLFPTVGVLKKKR